MNSIITVLLALLSLVGRPFLTFVTLAGRSYAFEGPFAVHPADFGYGYTAGRTATHLVFFRAPDGRYYRILPTETAAMDIFHKYMARQGAAHVRADRNLRCG